MTTAAADRSSDLRLARVHLRMGAHQLARAELEALAGEGSLDPEALLDLAEVRWRTGDLAGAGVAAQAYLGGGGESVLALVIAAEAGAASGRPTEARRLAGQAVERAAVPLEELFAGMPRSGVWPIESDEWPEPAGELFPIPPGTAARRDGTVEAGRRTQAGGRPDDTADRAAAGPPRPAADGGPAAGLWDEPAGATVAEAGEDPTAGAGVPATPEPATELAAARADLAAGRHGAAATRLAVILRLAPDLAPAVLDVLAPASAPPGAALGTLELVRGDAFRLVGREADARRAYAAASAALGGTGEPGS